jgi:hypothetical protein
VDGYILRVRFGLLPLVLVAADVFRRSSKVDAGSSDGS